MELKTVLQKFQNNKINRKIYIKEKNIVFGTISYKLKNSKQITGIYNTLGYILPDNSIYDFISKEVFEIYDLNKLEQEGHVFLVEKRIFEKSNKKINIKSYDSQIQPIIDYHMKRHHQTRIYENQFYEELKNPEYTLSKKQ